MKITTSCGHPWTYGPAAVGDEGHCADCGGAVTEVIAVDAQAVELRSGGRTFDEDGRELGGGSPDPLALLSRLQRHAAGLEPTMTNTEITAARTVLDHLAKQPAVEQSAVERLDIPATVSDDEAMQTYLRMVGE
jgi:hypothetical protein